MVGSPQNNSCIVNTTVFGVSSVNISWTGTGGVSIMNITNRVIISPTTSSGNIFTSNLQFEYLMEGDEGNYTCNVTILETSVTQSIELQSLTGKYFVSYKIYIATYLKVTVFVSQRINIMNHGIIMLVENTCYNYSI